MKLISFYEYRLFYSIFFYEHFYIYVSIFKIQLLKTQKINFEHKNHKEKQLI
jgi:hypothetical protein